jgi:hypothetical protein
MSHAEGSQVTMILAFDHCFSCLSCSAAQSATDSPIGVLGQEHVYVVISLCYKQGQISLTPRCGTK